MNKDQKHELGIEAVNIVNELSSGRYKVIVPGREDAVQVAEKILNKLISITGEIMIENKCGDCGVMPGELHVNGCDVERCSNCGGQSISCDCEEAETAFEDSQDDSFSFLVAGKSVIRKRLKWTGCWPGEKECQEFGWYSRLFEGRGWVKCNKNDPGATGDLNRLVVDAEWNAEKGRYQIKQNG